MKIYKSGHGTYFAEYHIVWIPKYRRRILNPDVAAYLAQIFPKIFEMMPGAALVKVNIQIDHIHMVATVPPKYAVCDVVGLILRAMMSREVPKADVVVTNPTHFAVALQYDRLTMPAPTVIAKGEDTIALKIREVAMEHNIPIIQNRPLAQEMCKRLEVGDIIPEDLFYAVSLVYGEIIRNYPERFRKLQEAI